jgi:prolyl oligopeptidase
MRLLRALVPSLPLALLAASAGAQAPADAFAWLSDVRGAKPLAWVEEQNKATLAALEPIPVYDSLYQRILTVLSSEKRIANPDLMAKYVYNFWQDSAHPRGIWRRTSPASYAMPAPDWELVVDVDALSKTDSATWAWKGATCLPPEYRHCLVSLSRGGGDAVEVREFDAAEKRFVRDGFHLPAAKNSVAWQDANALLIATDFGAGSMTTSGYPRIAKLWRRGTPLSAATTLFEGKPTDVAVDVTANFAEGKVVPVVYDVITFFSATVQLFREGKLALLDVPHGADYGLIGDRLVVYLRTPWDVSGHAYGEGSLIGIAARDFFAGKRDFETIVAPTARITIESFSTTKDYVLVSLLDNVNAELHRFSYRNGKWVGSKLPAPPFGNVTVAGVDPTTDRFYFTYDSFLRPTTLFSVAENGSVGQVKQLPAMFDATGLETRQLEAISADGTRIPYFVVNRAGLAMDGSNPTLLTAYGGFQVSSLPYYSATRGAAWLERGGVYVLANIRGGGEFGPSWHRAAQKEHRQRAYDDFLAVAQDLIARKVTSPAHLGINGGSNGGLLVGVALTERPDLFGAVVSAVPLLDMRGYTKLQAGASWIDEYGDPDIPEQWAYISKYSPYQNVSATTKYPPVLFTTTTADDRVGPVHARKMAALMESQGHQVLFFENTEGGHGAGDTPAQQAQFWAVTYTFLVNALR